MEYAVFEAPRKVSERVLASYECIIGQGPLLRHVIAATPVEARKLGVETRFPAADVKVVRCDGEECGYETGEPLKLRIGDFPPKTRADMIAYLYAEATLQDFTTSPRADG
jgi:hypothetical protein